MGSEVNATPRPLYPRERDPVPIVQEAGLAPMPVWRGAGNLAFAGVRIPILPARRWLGLPVIAMLTRTALECVGYGPLPPHPKKKFGRPCGIYVSLHLRLNLLLPSHLPEGTVSVYNSLLTECNSGTIQKLPFGLLSCKMQQLHPTIPTHLLAETSPDAAVVGRSFFIF